MRLSLFLILMMLVAFGVGATPAAAQTTYTFQEADDVWGRADNWLPGGGPPGADDTAIIPLARICRVDDDEHCKNLTLEGTSHQALGTVVIEPGKSLTIHGGEASMDWGRLELAGTTQDPATLTISGDVLILGEVSHVEMTHGVIEDSGGPSDKLTIEAVEPPFRLQGDGDIQVELLNKAEVYANHDGETLLLSGSVKDAIHDAFWSACCGGTLRVDVEVSGAAYWTIPPFTGESSEIVIGACCPDLSGNVALYDGTFVVEEPFCTTGTLYWSSVKERDSVTSTSIRVNQEAVAVFHGACPIDCS